MSSGISYYSVVVPNDAYFNYNVLINNVLVIPPWFLIYDFDGSIFRYGFSKSFSGTNTVEHPYPNGKLFLSIYGWGTNAGHIYVGGMKLNRINIQQNNGNSFIQ